MSNSYHGDIQMDEMEMDDTASGPSGNSPPVDTCAQPTSNGPVAQKRRAIQEILRDTTLSDFDRRLRIQSLMDGRPAQQPAGQTIQNGLSPERAGSFMEGGIQGLAPGGSEGNSSAGTTGPEAIAACIHYQRNCLIVSPCCNQGFGCRICHDEVTSSASNSVPRPSSAAATAVAAAGVPSRTCKITMDRFAIREVICKQCHSRQNSKTNKCNHCGIEFGEYHCTKCNLWMAMNEQLFHCEKCGFCRVGGRENYIHCDSCCMCICNTVYAVHKCMRDKYKNDCPVCREDMFTSRKPPQDLPCGHAIHSHCFRTLASFDYRCPICQKPVIELQLPPMPQPSQGCASNM